MTGTTDTQNTQDTAQPRRILITGATGGIGLTLVDAFREEYDIVQQGRTPRTEEQEAVLEKADLDDMADVLPLMEGVDTVVHLAGVSSPESEWDAVLTTNIVGTRNVLEAAREAGVRRVVLASSNHVLGMYDRHEQWPVPADAIPRPDSLYGVSKVFGEALGSFYHDEYGLDVLSLRIGWMSEDPMAAEDELLRAMWLSEGDAVRVVRAAIQAPVRHGVYYAISDNPNRRWDMTNTLLELGYRPQDSWTRLPGATEDVVAGGAPVRDDWPRGS